jgi:hypothetical protein
MEDQVCLPKTHLTIIFCVFIGLATWYVYNEKKQRMSNFNKTLMTNLTKTIDKLNSMNRTEPIEQVDEDTERIIFLNKRDKEVLHNEFAPPERRQPAHAYPYRHVKEQLNIPTRGFPDNYHIIGVVLRSSTESAFNLFGRQTYPGSNQWEYFVQGKLHDNDIKLPVNTRGNREIEDGQIILVPGTDSSKGAYKVKLYNYDAPRYNPMV